MTIIDSHVHFWDPDQLDYAWMQDDSPFKRRILPQTIADDLQRADVAGCVVIEATNTIGEIPWLLQLADQSPVVRGVIGWLDWDQPGIHSVLENYEHHPRFVGARLNWFGDNWSDVAQVWENLRIFDQFGLACDVLTRVEFLPELIPLFRNCPNTRFVINHLAGAKPEHDGASAWKEAVQLVQAHTNVYLKFSGYLTHVPVSAADQRMIADYLDAALGVFGENRLLFASNYPITLRVTPDYSASLSVLQSILAEHSSSTQRNILYNNAVAAYKLIMD